MRPLKLYARRLKRRLWPLPKKADGKIRLHLGCGLDYWPGYVNVDLSPSADCDLHLDFTKVGQLYPEGSVAEVAMIHSLSYLALWQARDLLADVYHLLQPNGKLVIELPDLGKCIQRVLETEGDLESYLEGVRGLYAFDLQQIKRREKYIPYAFGWSSWHLKRELEQIGFREVILSDPLTHGKRNWRDTRFEVIK
ncbi:hypothetical protein MYX84_02350 [Acidobacteria bacterium AH-259-O06]|nr:hypothetical protein [Acidobacteria bacterium AH-259-O06]